MSRYSLHFFTEGGDIDARLANEHFQALISYHAQRLVGTAAGPVDSHYEEDLYQEGMIAAYRLLERDPWMYGRTLLRLCVLAMYAARRRGKSVFRADPGDRLRTYEQVVFDPVEVDESLNWIDWGLVDRFVGAANEESEASSTL